MEQEVITGFTSDKIEFRSNAQFRDDLCIVNGKITSRTVDFFATGWGILTAIFFPPFLIFMFFSSDRRGLPPIYQGDCPSCNKLIAFSVNERLWGDKKETHACPSCHKVVSLDDKGFYCEPINLGNNDEKKCPYCAELVKKEALLCKHCNSKFDTVS